MDVDAVSTTKKPRHAPVNNFRNFEEWINSHIDFDELDEFNEGECQKPRKMPHVGSYIKTKGDEDGGSSSCHKISLPRFQRLTSLPFHEYLSFLNKQNNELNSDHHSAKDEGSASALKTSLHGDCCTERGEKKTSLSSSPSPSSPSPSSSPSPTSFTSPSISHTAMSISSEGCINRAGFSFQNGCDRKDDVKNEDDIVRLFISSALHPSVIDTIVKLMMRHFD